MSVRPTNSALNYESMRRFTFLPFLQAEATNVFHPRQDEIDGRNAAQVIPALRHQSRLHLQEDSLQAHQLRHSPHLARGGIW